MGELIRMKVAARRGVAQDITSFVLEAANGAPLPFFEAGAHIDVHVPGGPVRQYSLYELPGNQSRYHIGVLRDPQSKGGSATLSDHIVEGDALEISAPRNHFPLHDDARHSILLAGGIGITPILCMAKHLAAAGRRFDLHYCGRTPSRMAFVEDLRTGPLTSQAHIHADDGPADQRFDAPAAIGLPQADKHLYVCGPAGFMAHVLNTARGLGWDEAHLHREYFAGAQIEHASDGAFELELAGSGKVIEVRAEQSAAQALLDAGITLPLSCEQGVCGTCLTKVVQGRPDHRDLYLTDEEHARNDVFMPCCSRAQTRRLVIAL